MTKPRGYNVITAYTDVNPPETRPYLFASEELRDLYSQWTLESYEEKRTPVGAVCAYLIGRKPASRVGSQRRPQVPARIDKDARTL